MNVVRAVISARIGQSRIEHVRAHTGQLDVHSRMNEVADAEANRARVAAAEDPIPYHLAGEERVGLSVRGIPVIGSYRIQAARDSSSNRLASFSHQGALAAAHGRRFLAYCAAVSKTRNPQLIRFAAFAVTQWLTCELVCWKKARGSDNLGRGQKCKLCGAAQESVQHALCECQGGGLQGTRRRGQARARELLVEELEELGTLAQDEDVVWLGSGTLVPAWFDPSGEAAVRVPPNASSDTVDILREFSPLAGLLGILPPGLDEVLSW